MFSMFFHVFPCVSLDFPMFLACFNHLILTSPHLQKGQKGSPPPATPLAPGHPRSPSPPTTLAEAPRGKAPGRWPWRVPQRIRNGSLWLWDVVLELFWGETNGRSEIMWGSKNIYKSVSVFLEGCLFFLALKSNCALGFLVLVQCARLQSGTTCHVQCWDVKMFISDS